MYKKLLIIVILGSLLTLNATPLSDGMKALEKKDFKAAVKFFEDGTNEGDAIACANLAVMYTKGLGVEKDPQMASDILLQCDLTQ